MGSIRFVKHVADPIHGSIGLTQIEVDLISTPEFQRLRRVKQLGLVSMVFPSADYSRFAHSIGACHLAGRIADVINTKAKRKVVDVQRIRIAALLHDLGHYPFSHTFEQALKKKYRYAGESGTGVGTVLKNSDKSRDTYVKHESVGRFLLEESPTVSQILYRYSINHGPIADMITHNRARGLSSVDMNIISSDLDVDRLDYLLRSAHFSGLPFGRVDIGYLVSSAKRGWKFGESAFAFDQRAVNAVDHMLLARYFEYQQLVFHKTCAGLEWYLVDILAHFLEERSGTVDSIRAMIVEEPGPPTWSRFDDEEIMRFVHETAAGDSLTARKAKDVLARRPPIAIPVFEGFKPGDKESGQSWGDHSKAVRQCLIDECGLDPDGVRDWESHFQLLKDQDPRVSSAQVNGVTEKLLEMKQVGEDGAFHGVLISGESREAQFIYECSQSLLFEHNKSSYYLERVYVMPDKDCVGEKRMKFRKHLTKTLKVKRLLHID